MRVDAMNYTVQYELDDYLSLFISRTCFIMSRMWTQWPYLVKNVAVSEIFI